MMRFSKKFKTLGDVLLEYKIRYEGRVFKITQMMPAPQRLVEDLEFAYEEIPFDASEATIREVLIFPILKEVWRPYTKYLTVWGHKPIEVDKLSGVPDYLIAKRSSLGKIVFETPYVAVVEAKMDDFTGGWAQCALEMYAMQLLNKDETLPIHGIVSNGKGWEIAMLERNVFVKYRQRFDMERVDELFSALTQLFEFYKQYFINH
jgi:hypothetical protein